MSDELASRILRNPALMWHGHFETTSGAHTNVYWMKFLVLEDPKLLEEACEPIAARFRDSRPEYVVGPTLGGVFVAYEVARQLGAKALSAERAANDSERTFRAATSEIENRRVLVVDDVLMTGGTMRRVIELARERGGDLVGSAILLDRNPVSPGLTAPLYVVDRIVMPEFQAETCPLCIDGHSLTRLGGKT